MTFFLHRHSIRVVAFNRLAKTVFNSIAEPIMVNIRKYSDDGSCLNTLRGVDHIRLPSLNKVRYGRVKIILVRIILIFDSSSEQNSSTHITGTSILCID